MKKENERDLAYKRAMKVAKRIAITILCCVPIMGVVAYLLRNIITSNVGQIFLFIGIMAVAVLIVEIIARQKEKQKIEDSLNNTKRDVFK